MSKNLAQAVEAINIITGYDRKRKMVNAKFVRDTERLSDALTVLENLKYTEEYDKTDKAYNLEWSKKLKACALKFRNETGSKEYDDLYWKYMKFEAPDLFESYLFFTESNRDPKKQFYLPRYEVLRPVVQDLQDLEDGKYEFYGLSMPPRVGKLLSDNTPILTDQGWKNHGDLKVGDRVLSPDGSFVRVLALSEKCESEYKVEFTNGEEIHCHGKHEWTVYNRHKNRHDILETKRMAEDYENNLVGRGHRYFYMIPSVSPAQGEEKLLEVDPYTLGVWLGNGRNEHPDICGSKCDVDIIAKCIVDAGYEVAWEATHKTTGVRYIGFKNLREGLQKYGMCKSHKRTDKHIPEEYLTASIEQRLNLLAGLIDTDGALVKKEHRYQYSTTDEALRDGFVSLVSTFGWRCSVVKYEATASSSGVIGRKPVYTIGFNPTFEIPCRIERKQLKEFSKQRRIAISKIEKLKKGEIGNCIQVEGGVYLAGKTLIPTHNSTICLFFMSWIMGKRPNSHNAMSGHSQILADGFYDEALNLMGPEYRFLEVFPCSKLWKKSAEKKEITLDMPDRFATLTCRGIEGTWTGSVDISHDGYLYVDDLIRDREESLSPTRLESRYQDYLNVLVDRKNDGAKELMVGTRWNVLDPLGRVQEKNRNNPLYRFRKIPALSPDGKSNFEYRFNKGFSTRYYVMMRNRLDSNEWMAKYQQTPFVREGILFNPEELRYYNGILPEGDSRAVSVVDVAWGGGDSLSMPVGREYDNGDVYIFDWVFNTGMKEETIPLVTGRIMANDIHQIQFEANNGGDMYCQYVDDSLREQKYKCSCTHQRAPAVMAKMSKIIGASGDIKRRFIFLDADHRTEEYERAMSELTTFVQIGKNVHDDAADSLAQLVYFVDGSAMSPVANVMRSPI